MILSEIIDELGLKVVSSAGADLDVEITQGYACDLLSQVLASAKKGTIWMTIQSHLNIIGVAVMMGIPAIIVCEGHDVPSEVLKKAGEEGIVVLTSKDNAFVLSGKLYSRGIR